MIANVGGTSGGSSISSAMMEGPGGKMGKDEFLKLLVAQLRHQDPLNPMQGQEFASQLAQFTSVEQLLALNDGMAAQAAAQNAMADAVNGNMALAAIGKSVLARGDLLNVPAAGAAEQQVAFQVDGAGGRGMLKIYDVAGREVGSRDLGLVTGGRQTTPLGQAATGLPAGNYTFAVSVVDGTGAQVNTQTLVRTRIDGVRYTPEGTVLTGGGMELPLSSILEIAA